MNDQFIKEFLARYGRMAAVTIVLFLIEHGIIPISMKDDATTWMAGGIVLVGLAIYTYVRTRFTHKKAEKTALLTHALAAEIAPAEVKTSARADAIIKVLVADTAPAMPATGTSTEKVDAALAGAKP